jgi:ATP synthase protein I
LRNSSQSHDNAAGLEPGRREEAIVAGWAVPAAYLAGIGWFFATAIIAGALIGRWADSATGLEPIFTVAGIVLGLAVAMVGGFRMLMQFLRRFGGETAGKK